MNKRLIMLAILDGWGINDNENANAVKIANTILAAAPNP